MKNLAISFTAFIRYKQIKIEFQNQNFKQNKRLEQLNRICLYLIYLAAFGVFTIGNYRMTELLLGHGIGVIFAFGSAIIYFVLMGYLSLKTSITKFNENLAKIRLFIAFITCVFGGIMSFFGMLSVYEISIKTFLDNQTRTQWSENDPGYVWHCLSTLFEWLTVLCLSPYFATFIPEFSSITWKYLRQTDSLPKTVDVLNTDTNDNQVV